MLYRLVMPLGWLSLCECGGGGRRSGRPSGRANRGLFELNNHYRRGRRMPSMRAPVWPLVRSTIASWAACWSLLSPHVPESIRRRLRRHAFDGVYREDRARDQLERRAAVQPAKQLGDHHHAGSETDKRNTHRPGCQLCETASIETGVLHRLIGWQVLNVGGRRPGVPCPDIFGQLEEQSSTEFPNGRRNQFPNAPKNPPENKTVSVNNSVL